MLLSVLGLTASVTPKGVEVIPRRQDRVMLAALAIDRSRVWQLDELKAALWSQGRVPVNTDKLVRNQVSRLRARLGHNVIDSVAGGYRLGTNVALDVEELFQSGVSMVSLRARRGRPYHDVEDWPSAWPAIAMVERRLDELALDHAHALVVGRRWSEAIAASEQLVDSQPFSDRSWTLLVEALAGSAQRRDALAAVHRARGALSAAGLDLCADLVRLEFDLLAGLGAPEPGEIQVVSPLRSHRLPDVGTAFVGRVSEIESLIDALKHRRLACVVGLGGIGKTRLAIAAARRFADEHGVDVGFVALGLGPADDSAADVVARTFALPTTEGSERALDVWAATANVLVVLDNADSVLGEVERVAERLRLAGPNMHVLITSRLEPTRFAGYAMPLGPLSHDAAVELFTRRCAHRHPASEIAALCQAVDSVPLAIEAVAARAGAIHPTDIMQRLDQTLSSSGDGTMVVSVARIVEDSVAALDLRLRRGLQIAGLFPAPFTLAAFEAVCDPSDRVEVLDVLGGLTRHALLNVSFGTPTRYRLLDLVRAAVEPSTATDRQRLVAWGVAFAGAIGHGEGTSVLDDIPNFAMCVREACSAGNLAAALRLARFQMPLSMVGRTEGIGWAVQAVALVNEGPLHDEDATRAVGQLAWNLVLSGQPAAARRHIDRVIAAAPDSVGAGWARHGLAHLTGDTAEDDIALSIAITHDDTLLELAVRSTLASALAAGDPHAARAHAMASLERASHCGDPWAMTIAAFTDAMSLVQLEPERATHLMRRVRDVADRQNFQFVSAISRVLLIAWESRTTPTAIPAAIEALRHALGAGLTAPAGHVLVALANALRAEARFDEARAVNDLLGRMMSERQTPEGRFALAPSPTSAPAVVEPFFRDPLAVLRHFHAPASKNPLEKEDWRSYEEVQRADPDTVP